MKTNEFQDLSSLRFYSYATVTSILYNGVIEVSPLESMNLQENGLISSKSKNFSNTHKDEKGSLISSNVRAKNSITAHWLHLHAGNRITAPDVVKNEQVMIYKYANVDKYYWVDLGHDSLRRLETVKWRFGGLKDWNKDPQKEEPQRLDESSSYMMSVSTSGKMVYFSTSKANDEKVGYRITIDTAASTLSVVDDRGSSVTILSLKDTIEVKTKNEVLVTAVNKVIVKSKEIVLDGEVFITKNLTVKERVNAAGADIQSNLEASVVAASTYYGPKPLPVRGGNPATPKKQTPSEPDGLTPAERKAEQIANGGQGFASLGEFFASIAANQTPTTTSPTPAPAPGSASLSPPPPAPNPPAGGWWNGQPGFTPAMAGASPSPSPSAQAVQATPDHPFAAIIASNLKNTQL